jgi:hypothetical protein
MEKPNPDQSYKSVTSGESDAIRRLVSRLATRTSTSGRAAVTTRAPRICSRRSRGSRLSCSPDRIRTGATALRGRPKRFRSRAADLRSDWVSPTRSRVSAFPDSCGLCCSQAHSCGLVRPVCGQAATYGVAGRLVARTGQGVVYAAGEQGQRLAVRIEPMSIVVLPAPWRFGLRRHPTRGMSGCSDRGQPILLPHFLICCWLPHPRPVDSAFHG